MIDNAEQKRLKKEYKVIRGTYTVRVPDHVDLESSKENLLKNFRAIGYDIEDHTVRGGWKERK